jgi:30S ribosomal protein S31
MGKGDKKTRRGKITNGSYGKHRMRKQSAGYVAPIVKAKKEEEPKKEKKVALITA